MMTQHSLLQTSTSLIRTQRKASRRHQSQREHNAERLVPEQDLSVTLLADGKPLVKTVTKATDKTFLFNQSTYITCKNFTDKHTFQGAAMGTSFENSQPYIQFMSGRSVELACGY